ncbi:MAG TPA: hypothetical protein VGF22_01940 [Acidimicrobiales bacterium]
MELPGRLGAVSRRVGSAMEGIAQDVAGTVVPLAVDAVDVNELVERIDIDAVIEKVDINAVLARVDIDALIDRIDLNAVLDRVDPDRLVARLDMDGLLARVDVNELVKRIDLDAVVARTDLEGIIARSTSGVATQALDAVRSSGVGLDGFVQRWVDRVLGRHGDRPAGPPALVQTKPAP